MPATEGEPHLDMHPADAHARQITEGELVRIFNDRGSMQARVRVIFSARAAPFRLPDPKSAICISNQAAWPSSRR